MKRIFLAFLFFTNGVHAAVDQILNDYFYQNPAELSLVKKYQIILGNSYITPTLTFNGITSLGTGQAHSKAHDELPYLLSAYRWTDRFVLGVNITPSAYGHLNWSQHSIVEQNSTVTNILYYRGAIQLSYQLTDKLAVGFGANLEDNRLAEMDAVVPHLGNQVNKASDRNHTFDMGFFYKLHPRHFLTIAAYTPVNNAFGKGKSSLGPISNSHLYMNILEASVIYAGLLHFITDKWFFEEKLYWSGWSIGRNVILINQVTGTSVTPADWRDTFSFQLSTRYAFMDKIALLGSGIYETNAAPTSTNAIGYPLASSGALSLGLDFTLHKNLSTQLIYSYGGFLTNAKIASFNSFGNIRAHSQAVTFQLTLKA